MASRTAPRPREPAPQRLTVRLIPRLLPVAAASVRGATSSVNGGAPGDRQDRAVGAYDNVIMTAVRG